MQESVARRRMNSIAFRSVFSGHKHFRQLSLGSRPVQERRLIGGEGVQSTGGRRRRTFHKSSY
jgi:hypothetical protein